MPAQMFTVKIDGFSFSRWNYTAKKPGSRTGRLLNDLKNATSPWLAEVQLTEFNDNLEVTNEVYGGVVKVWPLQGVVKVEGADRMDGDDALKLGQLLQAAHKLLEEFANSVRCPFHGTADNDGPALDCEACFFEMNPDAPRGDGGETKAL